jgi:hypothetical protein
MSSRENTNKGYITTSDLTFNYDLSSAPLNTKMTLLTCGGVALMGCLTGDPQKDSDIWGWCPMPKRDKKREIELGLVQGPAMDLIPTTHGSTSTSVTSSESST